MFKKSFDLTVATIALVLLSPLMLFIAAVVKLSDGGAVLYRQDRLGLRGQWFTMLKFRSMIPDADKVGPMVTAGDDCRVTTFGRFLRETHLDDLPQLWHVLRGQMSLVGPRPGVPRYVARYTPEHQKILELLPGIADAGALAFPGTASRRQTARRRRVVMHHCWANARHRGTVPGGAMARALSRALGDLRFTWGHSGRRASIRTQGSGGSPGGATMPTRLAEQTRRELGEASYHKPPLPSWDQVEKFYLEHYLPRRIEASLAYAREACVWQDLKVLWRTFIRG